jgi:hypothetical protein
MRGPLRPSIWPEQHQSGGTEGCDGCSGHSDRRYATQHYRVRAGCRTKGRDLQHDLRRSLDNDPDQLRLCNRCGREWDRDLGAIWCLFCRPDRQTWDGRRRAARRGYLASARTGWQLHSQRYARWQECRRFGPGGLTLSRFGPLLAPVSSGWRPADFERLSGRCWENWKSAEGQLLKNATCFYDHRRATTLTEADIGFCTGRPHASRHTR